MKRKVLYQSSLKVQFQATTLSARLDCPPTVMAGLVLAHGAGAGMDHPFMAELATALSAKEIAVLRFQFPYMEAKKHRTDSPLVAASAIAAAVATLRKLIEGPVFAGGKSFGGRMTTFAASEGLLPELKGILCFGFPLHPADEPSIKRAQHFAQVPFPTLFLQGTRDKLADLQLMRDVCKDLPQGTLKVIEGADHGFGVLRRSGRTDHDVFNELVENSADFIKGLAGS